MKKNAVVGQSGGPTSVINASLYGVVYEALNREDSFGTVYGMINGIEGFLNGNMIDMEPLEMSGELELIRTTPGSYLGSCRYKLPEDLEDNVYPFLFEKFAEYNIGYFFYIGGNDSMDTVSKLSRYASKTGSDVRFIGIPKTIDNDLVLTDHTPGFGSAAKYVASTVREIVADASVYDNKKSVTIVEIMGRHAGWLTASAVLARRFKGDNPVLVCLPETAFDQEAFIEKVNQSLETTPNLVVCVSEGINDGKGTFLCELASDVGVDTFGHKMLTGSGKYLEHLVKDRLGVKVRSIELNVCQRCSSAMLSATDQKEAIAAGAYGVRCALEGETGKMVAFRRAPLEKPEAAGAPDTETCQISRVAQACRNYRIDYVTEDVNQICNREKTVPLEWITNGGTDIGDAFTDYALPLIQGEVSVPKENGLPKFAYRK